MKVTIVGAGNVGATCADAMAYRRIASEIVLVDIREGFAEGKALDIMQTQTTLGFNTKVVGSTNDYSKTAGSDVVVITSGIPRKPGMTREELIGISAGTVLHDCTDVADLFRRPQLYAGIPDKFQELIYQLGIRHFALYPEVDQLGINAVPSGPPFVFINEVFGIGAVAEIFFLQGVELSHQRLHDRSKADGFIYPHRHVTDPEFNGWIERVQAQVPPDLLTVINTAGLDKQLDVIIII